MATIIVSSNLKGGVTKTSSTINLGVGLTLLGKRVLLVDADLQGNTTAALGIEPSKLEHTTYTLITGQSTFEQAVKHTYFDKVSKQFIDASHPATLERLKIPPENVVGGPDILPCNIAAARAENDLIHNPGWGSLLRTALQPYQQHYDYIFIDTHPDLGKLTVNAFIVADYVLIPTVPEQWPTQGLIILCNSINEARAINPNLKVVGIVFSRVRYAEHTRLMEYIQDKLVPTLNKQFPRLHLSCFEAYISESAAFINATNRRSCVLLTHPIDAISVSYWAFLTELLKKIQSPDFSLAQAQFERALMYYNKQREQSKVGSRKAQTLHKKEEE